MHIFLISLATVTGITVGMLVYSLLGNGLGANIGLLVGIAIITISVYIVNTSRL